jgi:hypothetical protein
MSLLQQQILLGRCLQAADPEAAMREGQREIPMRGDETAMLRDVVRGPGFRFTRKVQRSWCIGRTTGAARLTLSLLPVEQRRRLVEDWVDAGGGQTLDVTSEAPAFLETVARHLSEPSHALSVCRMEQAAYRAAAAAAHFAALDPALLGNSRTRLRRAKESALVRFWAAPRLLFEAIAAGAPLPPLGGTAFAYLFAPGLAALRRPATHAEADAWDCLADPVCIDDMRRDGVPHRVIVALFSVGAIEPDGQ